MILACLLLAGCETVDTVRTVAKEKGAVASDNLLEDAEFIICRAATVGSVMRRYGGSKELAAAWLDMCWHRPAAVEGLLDLDPLPAPE